MKHFGRPDSEVRCGLPICQCMSGTPELQLVVTALDEMLEEQAARQSGIGKICYKHPYHIPAGFLIPEFYYLGNSCPACVKSEETKDTDRAQPDDDA